MRVVVQRVSRASVAVDGDTVGRIGRGLLLLVGVAEGDDEAEARRVAEKCVDLRVFPDDEGRFDRSLAEISGEALVVSQFTLLGDVRKGRRPSFTAAARPDVAEPLIDAFALALRERGVSVATGRFRAMMQVDLVNDGPVTLVVDSSDLDRPRRATPG
jgi:D-aminoacyl-tRNA deacylase